MCCGVEVITKSKRKVEKREALALFKGRDNGRFHDTKDEAHAWMFKLQHLRNIAVTPPYFHDGSVKALPDAVRVIAKLQIGRDLATPTPRISPHSSRP